MGTTQAKQAVLIKRGHTFIFRLCPGDEMVMYEVLARKAMDPNEMLDWFDVAIIASQLALDRPAVPEKGGK